MPRRNRPEGTRAPNGESSIYYSETDGYWHGWVTIGVKDDGSPDRRHRMSKDEKKLRQKVRELENQRDAGTAGVVGATWTVATWLDYWYQHISKPTVRASSARAYRTAVYHHLIPGLGKHRLQKVRTEHFEKLYQKIVAGGAKPATAHQVHRTAKAALNVAVARGYIGANPAKLAKYPRIEEDEVEPFDLAETQRLFEMALSQRNGVRFIMALSTGLRQGEVLGLKWADIDLAAGTLRVKRQRVWPEYIHGCGDTPCGRKFAGYCPDRVNTQPETADVKSKAGRRPFPLPDALVALLKLHKAAQDAERQGAGPLWTEGDWVFAEETGGTLHPRSDWDRWKQLLKDADVRDARLHDARHTAATFILQAGILDRVAQSMMGWSDAKMAKRYQHVVAPVQKDAGDRLGRLLWQHDENAD
jgi:integrase